MKWLLVLLVSFVPLLSFASDPVEIAQKYVGQTETHGSNRSPFIDRLNRLTGVPMGSPYCASFVSFVFREAGIKAPISAWSPDWFRLNLVPYSEIGRNDVFGLYFRSKGRIAHVGLIKSRQGAFWRTVEANTSPEATPGSEADRNGDGIFERIRPAYLLSQSRNRFSRYP